MKRTRENLLGAALPILQGLLASGHYTNPETETETPKVQRCDNGTDWNSAEAGEKVFARRHTALAIEDAISLAGELIDQIMLDDYTS